MRWIPLSQQDSILHQHTDRTVTARLSPELNLDEGVWHYLKRVELGNLCCNNLDHLLTELRKAIARLRHKIATIRRFFRHALADPSFT